MRKFCVLGILTLLAGCGLVANFGCVHEGLAVSLAGDLLGRLDFGSLVDGVLLLVDGAESTTP